MSDDDKSPLTDAQRVQIQNANRGRPLGPNEWRNFCCRCGLPLVVRRDWLALKEDLTCDDCRPAIQTGNDMSSAFSPQKAQVH